MKLHEEYGNRDNTAVEKIEHAKNPDGSTTMAFRVWRYGKPHIVLLKFPDKKDLFCHIHKLD